MKPVNVKKLYDDFADLGWDYTAGRMSRSTMTEPEEEVIVQMARFFIDNGWIDDSTQDAFDTLIDKICEPAPWDYGVTNC